MNNQKNTKKGNIKNSNSAITLIALVVTIIVLLILAGISISMLSGDNSILQKATDAKTNTDNAQIKEKIQLSYLAALTGGNGNLTEDSFKQELIKEFGASKITDDTIVTSEDGKTWTVTIDDATVELEAGSTSTPQDPEIVALPTGAGTTPYLPSTAFNQLPETTLANGLVITDAADPTDEENLGNEYVWIEVPNKNIEGETPTFGPDYPNTLPAEITEELTEEQKTAIETALIDYVTTDLLNGNNDDGNTSRMGWKDEFYTGCGIANLGAYNTLYNNMLKSVYNNGGFWIGRYEAGTETARKNGDSASGITPLSKIDQYPINFVTCGEAQTIAGSVPNKGSYNSSLMFGIQWDCVLKYLNKRGNVSVSDLTSNSEGWGNYDYTYDLNQTSAHGFKGILSLNDYSTLTWSQIESGYSHSAADGSTTAPTALSTGASMRNMKKNIYDLSGNICEWTLEHATSSSDYPCVTRGGNFGPGGSNTPVSWRGGYNTSWLSSFFRFPCLYILI